MNPPKQRYENPELEAELYHTFLELRDLLEGYAPAWYSEDLRERIEALVPHVKTVLQQKEK